ncbi:hypothetical protein GCM10009830_00340 [Glycomyces endophyticus]|uniref:Proteinase inhibitor I42 chagasin domain-containing protein n=1 Tax=Glycomyces endophyticus TaxID=480996 RepID=A0ABN2FTM0_9ACTN
MRTLPTALALAAATALAGCSTADETVALDAGEAAVAVGDTLRVDIGLVRDSVGDNWYLVGGTESGVLADAGKSTEDDAGCDGTGCGEFLSWDFEALAAGEAVLRFQYCFRTPLDACEGDADGGPPPEPVEIAVTVAD